MTKQQKPTIGWEKWLDPYGENMDEFEPTPSINANPISPIDDDDDSWVDESGVPHAYPQAIPTPKIKKPMKLIITPMGIIPLVEACTPSKVFNMWVGHTTFPITMPIAKIIEKTPGVEILNVFTKYRMRIGIAKMYDSQQVRLAVNENIQNYLLGSEKPKKFKIG